MISRCLGCHETLERQSVDTAPHHGCVHAGLSLTSLLSASLRRSWPAGRYAPVPQVAVKRLLADIEVAYNLAYAQFAFAVDRLDGDVFPFGIGRESFGAFAEPGPGCMQDDLRTLPDKVALNLCQGGKDVGDEPALTAGRVNGFIQAIQGNAFFRELNNKGDQMLVVTCQPIDYVPNLL